MVLAFKMEVVVVEEDAIVDVVVDVVDAFNVLIDVPIAGVRVVGDTTSAFVVADTSVDFVLSLFALS